MEMHVCLGFCQLFWVSSLASALRAALLTAIVMASQDTQKQILEYAKEACSGLGPNFKDQCLNYVELYGPLVVNMIVQYLKPELCIDAGYCPKVVPSSLYDMYVS